MATQTSTMEGVSTSQVRIQLSTRNPEIELPEDTGPILVATGKKMIIALFALSCLSISWEEQFADKLQNFADTNYQRS